MGWRIVAFFRGVLVAFAIIAAMFAFGIGKGTVDRVFQAYDPLLTTSLIFVIFWFGFANLFLESLRRRKERKLDAE